MPIEPLARWPGPGYLPRGTIAPFAGGRPRDRAAAWLRAALAGGPRRATDGYAAAAAIGIPNRTLERAKAVLGVQSQRTTHGKQSAWYWYDPAAAWPADAPCRKPFAGLAIFSHAPPAGRTS